MKSKAVFLAIFLICGSFALSYEKTEELSLSADGINRLEVDCGAGFLEIKGIESARDINVMAEIVLKGYGDEKAERAVKKYVELSLERRGNRAVLVSKFNIPGPIFSTVEKQINLTVTVPAKIDLDVDDGSGSIRIEKIDGKVDVDDGSGEIIVSGITGDLVIDDGSGSTRVENIGGDLDVDDGSGKIIVEDVKGSVDIDDGSGSIQVKNVGQNVTVGDGSGSITIDGVEGDVRIRRDGSGSVSITNVKGKVFM